MKTYDIINILLFLLLIVLPIILAFWCLLQALKSLKNIYILRQNPSVKIRSAAQGYVVLKGKTEHLLHQKIVSTLSKTPCLWHQYSIEDYVLIRGETEEKMIWRSLENYNSDFPFLINDGTGVTVLFPDKGTVMTLHQKVWQGYERYPSNKPSSFWDNFIAWLNGKTLYRYSEFLLIEGDEIFATGIFTTMNTINKDQPIFQQYPMLLEYINQKNQKNLNTINILNNEPMPEKHAYLISNQDETKIIFRHKLNALMFFLAFLFFCAVTATSIYPMIIKSIFIK